MVNNILLYSNTLKWIISVFTMACSIYILYVIVKNSPDAPITITPTPWTLHFQ